MGVLCLPVPTTEGAERGPEVGRVAAGADAWGPRALIAAVSPEPGRGGTGRRPAWTGRPKARTEGTRQRALVHTNMALPSQRCAHRATPHRMIARDAGQVIVAGFDGAQPAPELRSLAARGALGGYILFRRNLNLPLSEIAALLLQLRRSLPPALPPWLGVDQEGGRVGRLSAPFAHLPPMRVLGERGDPAWTERAATVVGGQLHALGFNLNFAPVLDVDSNPDNPVIGDRSFGREVPRVVEHGRAFAAGLRRAGIAACGKHFPGHGDTALDSHHALPRVRHPRSRLDAIELAPFRALSAALPTLMTAHVVFDALDPDTPATLSRAILDGVLRQQLGYGGVVFTDDLEMGAIQQHYGTGEAAVLAIAAGADCVLVCATPERVLEAHAALSKRAEADAGFAQRLAAAAARSLQARLALPRPTVEIPDLERFAAQSAGLLAECGGTGSPGDDPTLLQ